MFDMRIFLLVLFIIFSYQSWTKADDISEFEIDGMSIGDSLLKYMSINDIKKAEQNKINLPEDVAFFVAKQIRSNVRELEGALNRIVAMSNFMNTAININLAKESLKDLIAVRGRQVSVENIQKTVAEFYKIKVSDILSKKRSRNFSRPRQVAMTLTRELTNLSFPDIGAAFGGRHHTTIMHACDEIEDLRLKNQNIGQDLGFLTQVLRG